MNSVIDAREAFAGRAGTPVKFPAFSPNLRYLRNLCSGICRTSTSSQPVKTLQDGPSADLVGQIADALLRNVHDVRNDVTVTTSSSGWRVVFNAEDGDDNVFTYSFMVHAKWIVREKSAFPVA